MTIPVPANDDILLRAALAVSSPSPPDVRFEYRLTVDHRSRTVFIGILAGMYQNKYYAFTEPKLEVVFYRSGNGAEPVRDWLCELPKGARKAIGEDIKTVQFGWPLGMPLVRKMESRLWEVRCHIPNGIARVLFTVQEDAMVLLHGFIKKSSKTPADDLDVARQRMREVHDG